MTNEKIKELIERIEGGKYDLKQLTNLHKNIIDKGGDEALVEACVNNLAKLKRAKTASARSPSNEIAETRNGFDILKSAFDSGGNILKPELIEIAEELVTYNRVEDVSIKKTQIAFYYKGRHFTSGYERKKCRFYVAHLNDLNIGEKTIEAWEKLGVIDRGTYFKNQYIAVEVDEYQKLGTALESVVFV